MINKACVFLLEAPASGTSCMAHNTKTCPCNIQRFFSVVKIENFVGKNFDIFLIFAQNIDCGYTLELPR